MLRRWIVVLVLAVGVSRVSASSASGLSISFCGPANECTCIDWNNGAEVRCPSPEQERFGDPPLPAPHRDPEAGPQGPNGARPGKALGVASPQLLTHFNLAQSKAIKKGVLAARLPRKHDEWEPTKCMQMFGTADSGFENGRWIIDKFTIYREGSEVEFNGQTPCDTAAAWTVRNPQGGDSAYPYVFLCKDRFLSMSPKQAAVRLIHEALHTAGLPESANGGPGGPTGQDITEFVQENCPDI